MCNTLRYEYGFEIQANRLPQHGTEPTWEFFSQRIIKREKRRKSCAFLYAGYENFCDHPTVFFLFTMLVKTCDNYKVAVQRTFQTTFFISSVSVRLYCQLYILIPLPFNIYVRIQLVYFFYFVLFILHAFYTFQFSRYFCFSRYFFNTIQYFSCSPRMALKSSHNPLLIGEYFVFQEKVCQPLRSAFGHCDGQGTLCLTISLFIYSNSITQVKRNKTK